MAKIYGLFGAMTGKVADVVMVVRNGVQVARKYQPIVANPSTDAQVAARARLKLMSQLAAVMATILPLPAQGTVSTRNRFIKMNYGMSSYANNQADINMSGLDLTGSNVALPAITASRWTEETKVSLDAATIGELDVNRVVYIMFQRQDDGKLRLVTSKVVSEAGETGTYPTTLPLTNTEVYIYAYGIRDNTERARSTFGNMNVVQADAIARLIVSRTLLETDITLTESRYTYLQSVSNNAVSSTRQKK